MASNLGKYTRPRFRFTIFPLVAIPTNYALKRQLVELKWLAKYSTITQEGALMSKTANTVFQLESKALRDKISLLQLLGLFEYIYGN